MGVATEEKEGAESDGLPTGALSFLSFVFFH